MPKSSGYMKRYRAGGGGSTYKVTTNSFMENFENKKLTNRQILEIENQRREFYDKYKKYSDKLESRDRIELDRSTQQKYSDLVYGDNNANLTRYSQKTLQNIKTKAEEDLGITVRGMGGKFFPASDNLKFGRYTTQGHDWQSGAEDILKYDNIIKNVDNAIKKKAENRYNRYKKNSKK